MFIARGCWKRNIKIIIIINAIAHLHDFIFFGLLILISAANYHIIVLFLLRENSPPFVMKHKFPRLLMHERDNSQQFLKHIMKTKFYRFLSSREVVWNNKRDF